MENKKGKDVFNDGYERYQKVINRQPDSVLVILRSHLLVEYYLDKIIILKIPRGDIIIEGNFSFWQKLMIVKSLNILSSYLVDSLKNLNKIRNDCSHVLEYKISESDIDKIGRPFTSEYIKLKSERFSSIETLLNYTICLLTARLYGCVEKIVNLE